MRGAMRTERMTTSRLRYRRRQIINDLDLYEEKIALLSAVQARSRQCVAALAWRHRPASLLERDYAQRLAVKFTEARDERLPLISSKDRTRLSWSIDGPSFMTI